MQQWFWFGIALALILALATALHQLRKANLKVLTILSQSQNRQIQMNQTLTNLLLSKDPMTFQQLQTVSTNPSLPSEHVSPLDDETVARHLATQYEALGLDPSRAFAQDDDVDFRTEFGI